MSKFDETQWLGEAKHDLTLNNKAYKAPPSIFSTSKALLKENEDAYLPQIVSIGPYHFGKDHLREMETFKGDAARREVFRIQREISDSEFNFQQVIDKIRWREQDIRRCYDKGTPLKSEVLLWMVARDACFILEFFRNHLSGSLDDDMFFNDDFVFLPMYHPIFGRKSENHGIKSAIMKDLIKLENQIPLFILEEILAMEDLRNSRAKLDKLLRAVFNKFYYQPFEFSAEGEPRRRDHILDIYHHWCLGVVVSENEEEKGNEVKLNICCSCFEGAPQQNHIERERRNPPPSAVGGSSENVKVSKQSKVPSAVQLKNGGVKFQGNGKNVVDIRFEGKTLTLPPLKLDVDSEVYIRNLVALENSSSYYERKIMTAYVKFMYELCQTEKVVDAMREEGVLVGNLWQHSDAVRVFSVCKQSALSPSQDLFENTRRKLIEYYNRKFWTTAAILWNEFWNAYGSKPWLVAGGLGATTVLFLTAIQVICLFKHCGA